MDPRLQELLDHHEIRQLLATYVHGCDRSDMVEMSSIYCEESWDDHGEMKCDGKSYSKWSIEEGKKITNLVSHQLGQSYIKVDGDKAGAETYFIATLLFPAEDGGETMKQMGGRFVDQLERENGSWKVKKRVVVREWSHAHPLNDWQVNAGFTPARRGPLDVSYEALGLTHSGIPKHETEAEAA